MKYDVLVGDCLESLQRMPDQSVHTCVTSPPYFGLRDYGVDGQIGLEDSPDAYVARLVEVFREVRRVLRDDGTLWLNLGDSYAQQGGVGRQGETSARKGRSGVKAQERQKSTRPPIGLKPKDRMMIPARVAIALQDDGWYLRDEIVWSKPNAMPFSGKDRTTPAHEMIYMFSKRQIYFYDHEAVKEPSVSDHPSGNGFKRPARLSYQNADGSARGNDEQWTDVGGMRSRRSVWTVTTKPFKDAHFATFPPDLIEPCILAGAPVGGIVLDPFGGSGTTAGVALKHGRRAIMCELNPDYAAMVRGRVRSIAGMNADKENTIWENLLSLVI